VRDILIVGAVCVIVAGNFILRGWWRDYNRRLDEKEELHQLASDAAAEASGKYASEHPRELQAAIYGDGTAEDAAAYRKGYRAVADAAYNAVLADPVEARAAARWKASVAKIQEAKSNRSGSGSEQSVT
jgi:hypothetical protein